MSILITGADGFLGRHVQLYLRSLGVSYIPVDRAEWPQLSNFVKPGMKIIHLAGVNRGTETEVEQGNIQLANDLVSAFGNSLPDHIVFSNSIHAGRPDAYGRGKAVAASQLRDWATKGGGKFTDVRLPNLFGEDGRPFYNSFVATFVEHVVKNGTPEIRDAVVPLLHAQEAASVLLEAFSKTEATITPPGKATSVQEVWESLRRMYNDYQEGIIPVLSSHFDVCLFNTLRSRMFKDRQAINLTTHSDDRGYFVETARVRSGGGQTSFSTTKPGITRGQHFHLRKIERFIVMAGEGTIRLRHVLDDDIIEITAIGDRPVAIDMPTGWAHSITNTGKDTLLTQFWINEIYNKQDPDTFPESV